MKWSINSKAIVRWLRVIHRDIGFLSVGLCLIYAISGILLNHMDGKDPAFKTETGELSFSAGLDKDGLAEVWSKHSELPAMKRILSVDDTYFRVMCEGGMGAYNAATGEVSFETHTKRPFVYWINKLHYNLVKGWTAPADIFAGILIFLALSGLFIVKGKKGIAGSGKWYLLAGLLLPVIYILLT